MKRLLTFLFVLISYVAVAQTQPALPPGSQIYSSNLFLAPDSTVWTGKGGLYINLGSKRIFDQLLAGKLDTAALSNFYTKTQVDALINELPAGLELGETSTTAYRGDRGKIAYDYSLIGHLELSGGTVTGQIKRDSDAVDGSDLPRLSQVQALISSISIPEMSLSELNTGTDTTGRSIAAKTLADWLSAKNYIPVGANNTLLNNNAGFISVGTGNDQVRSNADLDLRYVQTETDPTVPAYVKSISESDINSWNAKLESVTGSGLVTVDYTDPIEPDVRLTNISRKRILGLGGGGTNTWTYKQAWGPTGVVQPWGSNVAYSSGSYCTYNGDLYLASGFPGVGVPPPTSPWTLVVNNFAGMYSNSVTYLTNQHVAVVNDGIYQTSAPIAGIAPGETVNNTPGAPVAITIGDNLILGADNVLRASQSTNIAGLIQAGTNVVITGSGYPSNPYIINAAGGGGGGSTNIYAGTNISVSGNSSTGYTINNTYTLPVASGSTLGGVKAGSGVTIAGDGTISVSGGGGGGSGITQLTGDVTTPGGGSGSSTIANGVVTNAKLANMSANTIKGRLSSSGAPQDLTPNQVRTMISTTAANTTTTIDMSGAKYQRGGSRSANVTFSLSNNVDGANVQVSLTNSSVSNAIEITVSGATKLGETIVQPGTAAVLSITNFGSGETYYTLISQL